MSNSRQVPM